MSHYLRRALLPLIVLVALTATACGSASKDEGGGVLRIGTEGVYAPFSYHDPATNELTGYDIDVARAVGEKLGRPVEFVETPWDSIFAALEANRFDVVANQVTITPERQAKYDLSEPYAVGEGVIVTRADDDSITSLDDLKGKVAAESATRALPSSASTRTPQRSKPSSSSVTRTCRTRTFIRYLRSAP